MRTKTGCYQWGYCNLRSLVFHAHEDRLPYTGPLQRVPVLIFLVHSDRLSAGTRKGRGYVNIRESALYYRAGNRVYIPGTVRRVQERETGGPPCAFLPRDVPANKVVFQAGQTPGYLRLNVRVGEQAG